jgi:hypothetical protein
MREKSFSGLCGEVFYLRADLATKELALAKLAPVEGTVPRFKLPNSLLAFLDSL